LKILLNASYGLSNDEYSFLRDRQVTLSICINGQLLLTQLMEEITSKIPDSQLIMMNTDGFEVKIPREYEELYLKLCRQWEKLTNLELEFVDYAKMIISDVNNYIAIYQDTIKKPKCKGKYEFENIPLHKNKSHSIIPIAFYEYFVNNIPVEETVKNHKNIFSFCAGVKTNTTKERGSSWYELHSIDKDKLKREKLSKTVRYFISTKGKSLIKCYSNGDFEHVEAPTKRGSMVKDWKVTYFNKKFIPDRFADYEIDYTYYISKTKDWINQIENSKLLNLFL
jgi:hypothetical protein